MTLQHHRQQFVEATMSVNQKDIDWLSRSPEEFKQHIYHGSSDDFSKERPQKKKTSLKFSFTKIFAWVISAAGAILLPFFMLIRGAMFMWAEWEINSWLALSLSAAGTMLLLSLYVFLMTRWISGKWKFSHLIPKIAGVITIAYCCYGLFYISALNTKTDEVRSYYTSLHPVLRVAVASITLADNGLVITDSRRELADYSSMGLPPNQNSLHFEQQDGFVHALDLRTKNRGELRNFITQKAFEIAGFNTLRHTGTADHLHISLPKR